MNKLITQICEKIHEKSPLILNLTNNVTMDFIANGLLSIGASPVMSDSLDDSKELLNFADALMINIGTINDAFLDRIMSVCNFIKNNNQLVVFDPVGAGATKYRTESAKLILDTNVVSILRGNASEIMALSDHTFNTHGVDSKEQTTSAIQSAEYLATKYNLTVVVSGPTDLIINVNNQEIFTRGSSLMPLITGTGCLLTSVIAAFAAVHDNLFEAAVSACFFYSVCGEQAAAKAEGPGTFKMHFLDMLNQYKSY